MCTCGHEPDEHTADGHCLVTGCTCPGFTDATDDPTPDEDADADVDDDKP